ncbi:hypothetical protein [Rhodococcus sp. NPDC058514]|uniref:hypothetical protein n=1 Tax=unclassified Rhodococcus (in: high G+C Gram-positive bacteria) TaxID=192944 RepID=UPI00365BF291
MENTASLGIQAFISEVVQRGGRAVRLTHSRRNPVQVWGVGDGSCVVRVRTKLDGDWQARKQDGDLDTDDTGSQFWVFVDLAASPEQFYVVPSEEVAADIHSEVDLWVKEVPGRTRTGSHSIAVERVAHGSERWDLLGLSDVKDPSRKMVGGQPEAPREVFRLPTKAKKAAAVVDEVVDERLQVVADFEGYRLVGMYDEQSGRLEITRGPMEGRRFDNPTVAANAVASHISGDVEVRDGWTFWQIECADRAPLGSRRAG